MCPRSDLPCDIRVAAIQTTAGPDRQANLEAVTGPVRRAAEAGATLIVLPEYFSVAGSPRFLRAHAETLDGPTVSWASDEARRAGVHLVAGSIPERPADDAGDARLSNTSCLIGPDGSVQAVYRKVHLFDVHLDGVGSCESATFAPGDTITTSPVTDPSGSDARFPVVLGLSLCYDIRFPEVYRIMTLAGATVVVVPAAFTAVTGPDHWELLLRARAVENQVFVIGAGQVGDLPPGLPACHGHSMIVDPWGTVLAERSHPSPGVVMADLDLAAQQWTRAQLPVLAHRRPEAYRCPDESTRGVLGSGR